MKVMLRRGANGRVALYVAKKDLEEEVVAMERPEMWGGTVTLANGWVLELPAMAPGTQLPVTVEARLVEAG